MEKMWGGRFSGSQQPMQAFTASIDFDRRLYVQDIQGSLSHARMLVRQGIISPEEGTQIAEGLTDIAHEIESGAVSLSSFHEDIHMNIEALLIERIGAAGEKLHTGRSRNDQVATDMHLYMKEILVALMEELRQLQLALLHRAAADGEAIMPGYTHLQRAQPVLLGQHLMAYAFMFDRDVSRLEDCLGRTDMCPLGAGALAGTSLPIDRAFVSEDLGFAGMYENSMDAVSDRDFLLEFLGHAAIIMTHLSRLSEELVLWSTFEFDFVELDEAYATGSSIMPQKKNPDTPELIRGKSGRVFGSLMTLLTVMKGLPLAYHTDMQEDKEAVFDTVDTLFACLPAMTGVIRTLRVKPDRMAADLAEDFSLATDVADYLVRRGLPFRSAHRVVGQVVKHCMAELRSLGELSLEEWQQFSPLFEADIVSLMDPQQSVESRRSYGGTASVSLQHQMDTLRARLSPDT